MKNSFDYVAFLFAGASLAVAFGTSGARAANSVAPGAIASPPAAIESASIAVVAVPVGVKIPAELTQHITTLTARVGDTFTFKTVKDETLGTTLVPAGTPGHGRVAIATQAHGRVGPSMSLQADSIDLPDGRSISVNIDNGRPIRGHLSDKHTHFAVLPILIGIVPVGSTSHSGNLVLDPGTGFDVITTTPRTVPAPLLTAPPSAVPSPA